MATYVCRQYEFRMPFFSSKLSNYGKTSRRKILKGDVKNDDTEVSDKTITLKLGDIETTFYNGQWIPLSGVVGETTKENATLRQHINHLEEENNLLKLKYEILLDMLAQTAST